MTGHLLGAAGAIELSLWRWLSKLAKFILQSTVTILMKVWILTHVREGARDLQVKCALSNSFGFGGHNGTLCVRRYEG